MSKKLNPIPTKIFVGVGEAGVFERRTEYNHKEYLFFRDLSFENSNP